MTDLLADLGTRRPTIYLATAEGDKPRGGVYHADPLRQAAENAGMNLVVLVAERSLVEPDQQHLVATLDEAALRRPGDTLVVTSATEFPVRAAHALPDLPMTMSSLTALVPEKSAWADRLPSSRAAAVTVESELGWEPFATAVGLPKDHPHQVVGSPRGDTQPAPQWHAPAAGDRRVAIPTLVRGEPKGWEGDPDHPIAVAGRGMAEIPLQAALRLREAGYEPVICPHPRENLDAYRAAGLEIATKSTLATVAGTESEPGFRYVAGPPGTVNADLTALSRTGADGGTEGPAVVAVNYDGLAWPAPHVYSGASTVSVDKSLIDAAGRGEDVALVGPELAEALRDARPATVAQAEAILGPRDGGAAERLVNVWTEAGRGRGDAGRDTRTLTHEQVNKFLQTGIVEQATEAPAARVNRADSQGPAADRGRTE